MSVVIAEISSAPLDVAAHLAAVSHDQAGAVSSFVGFVRNHDPEAHGEVTRLDYSAHPDAARLLRQLAAEVAGARGDTEGDIEVRLAVSHRIGELAVGDCAVVVCASSAHRAHAIRCCSELIERVKHELPIWKRQHTADGAAHWVGIS
ncbi:molybdenum cofactor biosynthesis protein MoaE [uncultured Gulosibacter sp.]|uniref:molybdenum cofactor biosynthesis protein MoaE n=1 Tax=uncultured Gulosibacter sp. TaxID=1339167 RepID=UPI00288ADAF4|nr:molybdenum cofactor biosynthesis protein MoaE [uncultured Gulosibacter sp.]